MGVCAPLVQYAPDSQCPVRRDFPARGIAVPESGKLETETPVVHTSSGKFMFNLKAANSRVILTSEFYDTKAAALNGIASVKEERGK
jgi:uncharacterized protein YegP (UPF0339 family)